MKRIESPSTVKLISGHAFNGCDRLEEVELFEGLVEIGSGVFMECKLLERFKVPSTVKKIRNCAFSDCHFLIGVELSEELETIEYSAFEWCYSLRSMAIPPTAEVDSNCFEGCLDLRALFDSQQDLISALKRRFDGLPVHKLCYYQPFHSTDVTIERLYEAIEVQHRSVHPALVIAVKIA